MDHPTPADGACIEFLDARIREQFPEGPSTEDAVVDFIDEVFGAWIGDPTVWAVHNHAELRELQMMFAIEYGIVTSSPMVDAARTPTLAQAFVLGVSSRGHRGSRAAGHGHE